MATLFECCISDPERLNIQRQKLEQKRTNDLINKQLHDEKKRMNQDFRILLLGCGEAGKSTFIKQMRIINNHVFSDEEKAEIRHEIAKNVLSAIQTLLEQTKLTDGKWTDFEDDGERLDGSILKEYADEILTNLPNLIGDIHPDIQNLNISEVNKYAKKFKILWRTKEIQKAYENRAQFQLVSSAKYFLDKVDEVLCPDYVPSDNDVVHTRTRTTGILEHTFKLNGKNTMLKNMVLIDVGGQRNERRKWIQCFEKIQLILFLTAVSEYDQVLAEDEETNRMIESIRLFKTILDYAFFKTTNIVLFLNKTDLLEEKIKRSPIPLDHFPEYQYYHPKSDDGKDLPEYDRALSFFHDKFLEQETDDGSRQMWVKYTCATDTQNIKVVSGMVQQIILDLILKEVMIDG